MEHAGASSMRQLKKTNYQRMKPITPKTLLPPIVYIRKWCQLLGCLLLPVSLAAQEFPKGWVFPLELGQGTVTAFHHTPDLYLASLSFAPQYTVITGRLRAGAAVGGVYTNKKVDGIAGPRLALLLTDKPRILHSTLLNLQLVAEHLWGTRQQRLAGGGLTAEVGQLFTLSLKAHRDYHWSAWWLQACLGINLFSKKPSDNPFEGIN